MTDTHATHIALTPTYNDLQITSLVHRALALPTMGQPRVRRWSYLPAPI